MESLEHTLVLSRLIVGLLATVVVLGFAAKRVWWLARLISSGQKVGDERGKFLMPALYGQPESRGIHYVSPDALEGR